MEKNKIILTTLSVIAIFAFLTVTYILTNKPEITLFPEVSQIKASDHMKWSPKKKHILVEYSDLQCPACQYFHTVVKNLESEKTITENITFVYRHFPLDNLHPNARAAAHAAEAAGLQGKFFQMHDILFDKQDEWAKIKDPTEQFVTYARTLGLEEARFRTDMTSDTVKNKVQADLASGNSATVNSTPTFYLDGKKLTNVRSVEEFRKLLITTATGK